VGGQRRAVPRAQVAGSGVVSEVSAPLPRLAALAAAFALTVPAIAQDTTRTPDAPPPAAARAQVPWGVGEYLEYDISFGKIHVGNGNMEVLPMDTVRGHDAWHTIFRLNGGIPFYRVHDKYEDWLDVETLSTLRSRQDIDEGGYEPKRLYEIYPDRREYVEVSRKDAKPMPSVARPLSDASFIYFLRTVPLRVGMDTSFSNYFRADRNPVRFKVVRRDTIKVGAGKFATIVVQPSFASKLFCSDCRAEVWLSDDDNRIIVQMKSKVSFGSLNLYLKKYTPSPTTSVPLNRVP
jgi:hypothetical protein